MGLSPYGRKPQSLWLQLLHGRFHLAITSASWILWAMLPGKLSSLMAGRDGWTVPVPVPKASPLEAALVATEDRSFHGFGCRKVVVSLGGCLPELCRRPWITMAGATKQLMDVAKKFWRSLDFVISYLHQASVLVGLVVSMVAPCWGIPGEIGSIPPICTVPEKTLLKTAAYLHEFYI